MRFGADKPLPLDAGTLLSPFQIAYQTYGTLNAARSNAILVCHALTGDQHVASTNPVTGKPGWWDMLIGPGKPIDTDRFFVICANVIGGCMGTTGPASTNPATGKPYGLDLPVITIGDMVRAQAMLLDHLGIEQLFCGARRLDGRHAGAAMGGELSRARLLGAADRHRARAIRRRTSPSTRSAGRRSWPTRTGAAATISSTASARKRASRWRAWPRTSPICRKRPCSGSSAAICRTATALTFGFDADFQIESYLRHQGMSFVDRFDANSYLYITRAMDYFDLAADHGGVLADAFRGTRTRFCVVSFTSRLAVPDRGEPRHRARAERRRRLVTFVEIETDKGHDAFLLDEPELFAADPRLPRARAARAAWRKPDAPT